MTEKNIRWTAEIVTGQCPACDELTTLVGITKEFYRCMTCGSDCKQHVNGKLSYLIKISLTPIVKHEINPI